MPRCPIVELYPVFGSCNNAVIWAMLRPFLPIIYVKNVFTFSCELNDFRHFSFFSIMCGSNRGCTIPPPRGRVGISPIFQHKNCDAPWVGQIFLVIARWLGRKCLRTPQYGAKLLSATPRLPRGGDGKPPIWTTHYGEKMKNVGNRSIRKKT